MGKQHKKSAPTSNRGGQVRRTAQQAGFDTDARSSRDGAGHASKKARVAGKQQHVRPNGKDASSGKGRRPQATNARKGNGKAGDHVDEDEDEDEEEEEEEEVDISNEDVAFFKSNPSAMSFLSSLDAAKMPHKKCVYPQE